jgi:GNAT superfamily N-acetyltransferase
MTVFVRDRKYNQEMLEDFAIEMSLLDHPEWSNIIRDVIAVRTSAYLDWNGPRTDTEQKAEAEAWLERWRNRRSATLFAARTGGKLVGYLIADERERGEHYIAHIGVHGEYKRRGIGRALIRRCEEQAVAAGCRAVTTTTYNRYPGMLILLLQEGFYVQGMSCLKGSDQPRLRLRKELAEPESQEARVKGRDTPDNAGRASDGAGRYTG